MELSAKRDDTSPILTRTIGDPHTGTDPISPKTTEEASPTSANQELPPVPPQSVDATIRPNYLKLPAPQDFSLQRLPSSSSVSMTASTLVAQTPGTQTPPSSPGYEPGLKVLVVDDDPLTRKLMSRMLTRVGCRVSTAENGEMALDMITGVATRITPCSEDTGSGGLTAEDGPSTSRTSTSTPDDYKYAAVFLDNQMPVMSGLEAVAKLRELGRKDFVVGVTGMLFLFNYSCSLLTITNR